MSLCMGPAAGIALDGQVAKESRDKFLPSEYFSMSLVIVEHDAETVVAAEATVVVAFAELQMGAGLAGSFGDSS